MGKSKKKKSSAYEISRTPVVAVMGHVDHGKTSILDAIRGTEVQAGEEGGITQNTRAHQVVYKDQKITFVDTPGHEAFSEMRARGASVTDIVLLVVAADDGVQPQTKESINFALKFQVPIIVAINKIDLPGKKLEKLKQELTSAGLVLEEYGGEVMVIEVSAKKKTNIDEIQERVLLLTELSELEPEEIKDEYIDGTAFVLESTLDKTFGPVTLAIIKAGKISKHQQVLYSEGDGKIRTLLDENQKPHENSQQGDPIWIVGLKDVLKTGEVISTFENKKSLEKYTKGIEILLHKEEKERERKEKEAAEKALEEGAEEIEIADLDILADLINNAKKEEEIRYLNVILKASTHGTLEAVEQQIEILNSDDVQVKLVVSSTGDITENDIKMAKDSFGIIIGFQVTPSRKVIEIAKKEKVLLRNYSIIYELIDELSDVMDGMEEPVFDEIEIARALVKKSFKLSNGKHVAGCIVEKGKVIRGYKVFIEREGEKLHEGKITSLKKLKNEVKEVKKGEECGILLDPDFAIAEGDSVVCFKLEQI